MKLSTECLEASQVDSLLQGNLTPEEYESAQNHLELCETCRARVEATIGPEQWWSDVQSVLLNSRTGAFSQRNAFSTDAEPNEPSTAKLLDLLGPTDDPNMLGRIGPYEIIGLLGQGGMGAVFKGFDRSLNRFVAIKMLLPHLAASGAARKRFAREGQAVAAVVDDHVMAIHCVDEWQGVPYLVMTYSRGVSLQKRLSDNGPLEVREILRIGMQAAKGLAAAHAQGIVHRDIKPANIFLDQNVERVQLMDFGLARAVDDASLTRSGTLAGTPQYMSPEQARAETVDHRSDLFSLGCVMYAMCTGRPPFRADNSYAILRMIADDEPRSIRDINPDIPEWLCNIIRKLMAKSAADRFESATAVATLLEQCLAHVHAPTNNLLPHVRVMFRVSLLKRLLPIMSDKRILSFIAFTLFIAAILIPWPIAAMGRDEPAFIFAGFSAGLAICFAVLSRAEYFSRLILWFVGVGLGLIIVGMCVSVPLYVWRKNQALVATERQALEVAERQKQLAEKARDAEEISGKALEAKNEARIRENEQVAAALDRMNARSVVEAYVAAAFSGQLELAASLAKGTTAERKFIEWLSKKLNVQRLVIESVYVNDPAKPATALAISEAVKRTNNLPDGQRDVLLALTLTMSQQGWLVTDIDLESEEGGEDQLKRFREANPSMVDVTLLNADALPGTDSVSNVAP